MDKIEIVNITLPNTEEVTQYVIIDRGNGEFTSMPKAVWDELEAAKEASGTLS